MSELLENARVGDVVASDFRAAAVFQRFGIDFCCGGRRSIADACRGAGVDQGAILAALESLRPEDASADDVASWPIGRLVAQRLGFQFVDTAAMIVERAGMQVSEIFERHGEAWFREQETATLRSLSVLNRAVISTGGGIVLREEHHALLRELGFGRKRRVLGQRDRHQQIVRRADQRVG